MKKIIISLLALAIIASLSSCSVSMKNLIKKRCETRLTKNNLSHSEIAEDIDYYIKMVEKISPYPYFFTSRRKIDSTANAIKKNQELSPLQFYEKFLRLQAAYNVAHMYSFSPKKNYNNYLQNGGIRFPFVCKALKDTLYVLESFDSTLPIKPKDKIRFINGKDADSLFYAFYSYEGGLESWKNRCVSEAFSEYLWLNNIYSPYTLEVTTPDEKSNIYTIKAIKHQEKNASNASNDFNKIINYKRIQDSIAVIDFESMLVYNENRFDNFLKETFKDIKDQKTTMLIIDLRNNGGGDSKFGKKLIDCFNSKPYRMAAGKKWLVSKEYKKNFRKMFPWYIRKIAIKRSGARPYFKHKNGEIMNKDLAFPLEQPAANEYRFNGPVYVLISTRTFSSAMLTSNGIGYYKLATLVGEPTGETPNDLGEIVPVRLPNSGITCWIPSALFVRASGDEKNSDPVLPDIEIENVNHLDYPQIIEMIKSKKHF